MTLLHGEMIKFVSVDEADRKVAVLTLEHLVLSSPSCVAQNQHHDRLKKCVVECCRIFVSFSRPHAFQEHLTDDVCACRKYCETKMANFLVAITRAFNVMNVTLSRGGSQRKAKNRAASKHCVAGDGWPGGGGGGTASDKRLRTRVSVSLSGS